MKKIGGLILALIFVLQGCGALVGAGVGAGAAAAGYRYAEGNLETTYNYPLNRTVNATTTALKESGISVNQTQKDPTRAFINATRNSDNAPVTVNLTPEGPNRTNASIRVGMLGDEDAARVVNNKIVDQLKKG